MSVSADRPNLDNTLAFLFPGQGGQAQGLGFSLAERSKKAADIKQMAADIFGGEFVDIWANGPIEKIDRTRWTQYIVGTDGLMRMAALEEEATEGEDGQYDWLVKDGVTLEKYRDGMSFGEIVAGAGIWYTPEQALLLIRERGIVMGDFFKDLKAKMFALEQTPNDIREEMLEKFKGGELRLCLDNTDGDDNQKVYGGPIEIVDESTNWLLKVKGQTGENVKVLTIEGVFHHPLLTPAAKAFTPSVMGMKMFDKPAQGKVLMSNRTGLPLNTPDEVRAEFIYHNVEPVLHSKSMKYLVGQGVTYMAGVTNSRRLAIMNQDMFEGDARVQITMRKKSDDDKPPVLLQGWKAD